MSRITVCTVWTKPGSACWIEKLWRVYQTPVRSGVPAAAGMQVPFALQVSPAGQLQGATHSHTCADPDPVHWQVSPAGQVAPGLFGSQFGFVGGTHIPLVQT